MPDYKVLFYAPLNNSMKSYKYGGGEVGCKRTKEILIKNNYNVITIKKPILKSDLLSSKFLILIKFINSWFKLIFHLFENNIKSIHIVGFYKTHVIFEWIILITSKIFRKKIIYEIRNGGMINEYKNGNFLYRFLFRSILYQTNAILCQGENYVTFIKKEFGINSYYYPNFIMNKYIFEKKIFRKKSKIINLIYFGRIVQEKNIEFIIDICQHLKFLNIKFNLDLIGSSEPSYYRYLLKKIDSASINCFINFHGKKDFVEIIKILKKSHFFIFPSKEKNEGHSNAITEAMAFGVIPIVSNYGFNKNVVNDDDLVIEKFNPIIYTEKILNIWLENKWSEKSNQVYKRILENYTEEIVSKTLLGLYDNL
jgi:glycosyltransferase involved in cell wall biosynthesis